jgi:hypothetical protein
VQVEGSTPYSKDVPEDCALEASKKLFFLWRNLPLLGAALAKGLFAELNKMVGGDSSVAQQGCKLG